MKAHSIRAVLTLRLVVLVTAHDHLPETASLTITTHRRITNLLLKDIVNLSLVDYVIKGASPLVVTTKNMKIA